jgi:hypothetical protein
MNENHDLDPQLEKELARVREVPARDPNAAARGRARFLAEASVMRPKPVERKRQVFIKRYAWQAALATMVVLVLVFGGGAGAALAAQDDLPNQPLYPVKLITEDVRLNLASGSQAKIDLLLQFVDVRIDEMNQLVVLESDIPVKTTDAHTHTTGRTDTEPGPGRRRGRRNFASDPTNAPSAPPPGKRRHGGSWIIPQSDAIWSGRCIHRPVSGLFRNALYRERDGWS